MKSFKTLFLIAIIVAWLAIDSEVRAQTAKKPNILVIMTDDVGVWNVSAYHRGMMGGRTPNIDRIAKEGALFTDYYAQQSCTAGRAAFITWTDAVSHGSVQGRHARRQTGFAGLRSHDRRTAQAAWLRHRADRKKPSRGPQRVLYPPCMASTSSTASSTTSTPWKSRTKMTTRRVLISSRSSVRETSLKPEATDKDDRHDRSSLGPRGQADD